MATPKPTIVIVPGAWHSPTCFAPTTSLLESAGYTCIGVSLKSVGADPPLDDFKPDVEAIRAVVQSEVDAGHDVLVLMHSYGSVPAGEAVKGLDKVSRRKEGHEEGGGVSRLVYCCAFAPPKGASLWTMLGEKPLPWFKPSADDKLVNPDTPTEIFYADVTDRDLVSSTVDHLKPHSYQTFRSKATWEPYRDIPSTYVYCTLDQAIPIEVQKGMVEGGAKGVKWETETLEASHSPFLSVPKLLADVVRRAAGETV